MRRLTLLSLALAVSFVHFFAAAAAPASAQTQAPSVESFVTDLVVRDVDAFWTQTARANNRPYSSPRIRLMQNGQPAISACGKEPIRGHTYCGADRTIYLDVSTTNAYSFGSLYRANEDFAIVAIIAHEWAHHVQNVTGLWRGAASQTQLELQADCMAGLFTRWAEGQGRLDPGDLDEGIAIATRSGDPAHGTGPQRADSFLRGYRAYSGAACGIS